MYMNVLRIPKTYSVQLLRKGLSPSRQAPVMSRSPKADRSCNYYQTTCDALMPAAACLLKLGVRKYGSSSSKKKRIVYHIKDAHWVLLRCPLLASFVFHSSPMYIVPKMLCNGNGAISICKLKWDLLMTSITACTIDECTFSAPFGIFYVRTEIWKEMF